MSRLISFFRKLVSESSSLAVAQLGFFCRRIHTAFMTVRTRKGGRAYTLKDRGA